MKSIFLFLENIQYLDYFQQFNIPKDKAIIVGSGHLVALGYLKSNNDLDIVVPKYILEKIKNHSNLREHKPNIYITKDGKFEIGSEFLTLGETFESLDKDAVTINGYKYMSFPKLLKFYQKLNRPKDQPKIKLLKGLLT